MTPDQICSRCKFWRQSVRDAAHPYVENTGPLGLCDRWEKSCSGSFDKSAVPANGIVVEYDEEWGAMTGPEFGCVLFEAKP